jgi:hypothetical protein
MPMSSYARFEQLYADAIRAIDPVAAFRAIAASEEIDDDLRASVETIDPDGVRMTALLVAKLRFERLMNGSLEADAFFDERPAEFAAAFRRYHAEMPMQAFFPSEEGALFATWCAKNGIAL